jgi:hypothetical protein
MTPMQNILRLMIAAVVAVALVQFSGEASAQGAVKQVQLTDKLIDGFISAQKDMLAVSEKMQSDNDKPDPKIQAELESIAKKHGFARFEAYDDVVATIDLLMYCIHPQTKEFTEPKVAIQKEIEDLKNDKTTPENQKKQILEDLNDQLKAAPTIQFASNIDLVKKYYDKIDAARQ